LLLGAGYKYSYLLTYPFTVKSQKFGGWLPKSWGVCPSTLPYNPLPAMQGMYSVCVILYCYYDIVW